MKFIIGFFLVILTLPLKQASALDLGIPIACEYGVDCFIENYFDHSSKRDEVQDHTCGAITQDGNLSTDFILQNYQMMKEGVNVVAGDSGIVLHTRDGMSDISVDLIGEEAVRGRECGNGVIIEHKRGYVTQYCHLKKNSILVKPGEKVEKGETIAEVGVSGITTFPYLEFTVRLDGEAIDPFTGENPVTGERHIACESLDIYPLWDKKTEKNLKYISTALLGMGFANKVPHAQGSREGKFSKEKMIHHSKLIAFWVDIFGVQQNDKLKLIILDPDGDILSEETREFKTEKRHLFQFMGKKNPSKLWPLGEYTGRVELIRSDTGQTEKVINSTIILKVVDNIKK